MTASVGTIGAHMSIAEMFSMTPPGLQPDGHAARQQILLALADGVCAVVEDRCREHGARAAPGETFVEMLDAADAARGDHRNLHGAADAAREGNVVPFLGAVSVHAGEQDLTGTGGLHTHRPL